MPQHLTEAQKSRAIAKLEDNWTLSEVAAELNVSKSCIFYVKKRWQDQQRLRRRVRQGVGKVSNENQDNALIEYIRQNPFATAVKAREETLFPRSLRTAQMRLKQAGLKNGAGAHKVFLTAKNKRMRIQFANEFLMHGMEFWNNMVFSDEKTFQSTNSERLRVYRPRNSRFKENYTLGTTNSGRFSVSVWAWISVNGSGMCWQIDGRLTAENYVNILDNVMLPSVREVFPDHFTFQHDNSPVHTARIVREWLNENNINVLPWPPKSPDLNPIENVEGFIVKNIYQRDFGPANRDQLSEANENVWEGLVDSYDMRNLISTMPRRLQSVVAGNGSAIKY